MEDPRTRILRSGLKKVFMFAVAVPGRANLGSYICRGASLTKGRHRAPTERTHMLPCSRDWCQGWGQPPRPPRGQQPCNCVCDPHEMAEPLTSFSCTTFRHSFIWPRWSFLYLINWFSVHFWLFSISSYTFVESELNLRKTISMSEFKI